LLCAGATLGNLAGGTLAQVLDSNQSVFLLSAAGKVLLLPFALALKDEQCEDSENSTWQDVKALMAKMWHALQQNRIWKPTLFIFFFSALPNTGSVMPIFYVAVLKFTQTELSSIFIVGGLAGVVGMVCYNRYLKHRNWHMFFIGVILLSSACGATQLILVSGLNRRMGMPDFPFALGDEVVIDIAKTLLGLPLLILVAAICPKGMESTVYGLVTSMQIAGSTVGSSISAWLIDIFGITLSNFDYLGILILLCAGVRLLTIPFVHLLPTGLPMRPAADEVKDALKYVDSEEVSDDPEEDLFEEGLPKESWWGAVALLGLLFSALCWALGSSLFRVIAVSVNEATTNITTTGGDGLQ